MPNVFGEHSGPIFKGKISNEDWTFHPEDETTTLPCNTKHQAPDTPTDMTQYPKILNNLTPLLQKSKT